MSFDEWKDCTLADLVKFQRGHDLTISNIEHGPYPVAGSNGPIGFHKEFTTKGPSLTLGRSGNSIGVAHFYEDNFWAHNTTLYAKEFYDADPKFIYYLLKTIDFKGHNSGSAVPSLNRNLINPYKLRVPSLQTQKRIVAILSSLDERIELNRQTAHTLEAIAQAIFKEWFVDFNFPGATGEMQDGIPVGWKKASISEVATNIQYGYTQSSSQEAIGPKFLRITDIQGGTVNWANVPFCKISDKEFGKYQIKEHDIFIARTGASTGENVYIVNPPDAVFASYLIRVQFRTPELACYVGQYLRSNEYFEYIASVLSGSAQPNANAQQLTAAEILLPDNKILEKYFELVNPLNQFKAHLNDENQAHSHLRNSLLPKLMKGDIQISF